MRPGIIRVGLNCSLSQGARLSQNTADVGPPLMNCRGAGPGEKADGSGIVRLDREGPLQQSLGGFDLTRRTP